MKHLYLTLLLVLPALAFCQRAQDMLTWSEDHPLTWQDFKGRELQGAMHGQPFMVLDADYDKGGMFGKVNTYVTALFDRKDSWVAKDAQTPQLLKLYQVMFNLYEVYACHLRASFAQTDFEVSASIQFNDTYIDAKNELKERVKQLMHDTEMGVNATALNTWDEAVKKELDGLKEYRAAAQ